MKWLSIEIGGSEAWRWLAASGLALVTVLAIRLLKSLLHHRVRALAERNRTRADDIVIGVLEQTKWFFYLALGVYLGSRLLELPREGERWVVLGATLVALLQLGIWGKHTIRLSVDAWRRKHSAETDQTTIAAGIAFIAQLVVWTIVVLMALANMGVEITALVAGLGMGGIAAALAIQNILGDLFAALSIYFDRPFDIGDFIAVGSEDMGRIERIGLRSTRIRGLGGEQLVFPNRELTTHRIKNYRRLKERRVELTLGLDSEVGADKIARAVELLREIVAGVDGVRFERAHFAKFGDTALLLELVYWVQDPSYLTFKERQHEVNLAILRRFEEEGLKFASPTSRLLLRRDDESELARQRGRRERRLSH